MFRRTLGVAFSQVMSVMMVTPAAGSAASVRPWVRVANFEPEDSHFETSVQQRLQNHERRIGQLEKVTSRPVGAAARPAAGLPASTRTTSRPVPAKSTAGTHTVRPGESPSSIARRYGVPVAALMKANRLGTGSSIQPGQRLQLPDTPHTASRTAVAPTHPAPKHPAPAGTSRPSASGSGRYGHATPPSMPDVRYTVKPGDTVHSLAARHGISERELCRRNGLSAAAKLRAGTTLKLPVAAASDRDAEIALADDGATADTPPPLPDGWHWHSVERGESLSQIAAHYGTDRRSIERVNNLVGGSAALRDGLRLKIPPAEVASSDLATPAKPAPVKRWQESGDDSVLGYTVQKGDTLDDLADQFKTSAPTLRRLNRLGSDEKLAAGRRIVVPNTLFE